MVVLILADFRAPFTPWSFNKTAESTAMATGSIVPRHCTGLQAQEITVVNYKPLKCLWIPPAVYATREPRKGKNGGASFSSAISTHASPRASLHLLDNEYVV